jgi:protoheme IX farnesyltransferase
MYAMHRLRSRFASRGLPALLFGVCAVAVLPLVVWGVGAGWAEGLAAADRARQIAAAWGAAPLWRAGLALSALAAAYLVWRSAWREGRSRPVSAIGAAGLLVCTGVVAYLVMSGAAGTQPLNTQAIVVASSCLGVWLSGVAVAWGGRSSPGEVPLAAGAASARDYLTLTKPIVVSLLLVSTLAGMIVGAGTWPGMRLVALTLVGGALSAGGASALNQYIDRERDGLMRRTARRPLPAGRLAPFQVIGFGLALCVAGFYLLAIGVNLLSGLLAVLGMVYYLVLYSLILKPTTPQNIVVGGGAGAIPPLVGWAAATGRLDMAAFFLFAVVFFWTPPHFWALALLRRRDYERAGVPMLPVIHGEQATTWQILLYTIQLVALTLLLPLVGVGGLWFVGAALALGLGLGAHAWRLWRGGSDRVAYRMYRYSSMYLALLFAAMVADTLLRG